MSFKEEGNSNDFRCSEEAIKKFEEFLKDLTKDDEKNGRVHEHEGCVSLTEENPEVLQHLGNELLQAVKARKEAHAEAYEEQKAKFLQDIENFELFENGEDAAQGWINIDDDNRFDMMSILTAMDTSIKTQKASSNSMDVDEQPQTSTAINSINETEEKDNDKEIDDLATKIKDTKQGYLSEEIKEKIVELTEAQKIYLLKLLSNSEHCIISLCLTIADKVEARDQNVLAALICTHILVDKAKQSKLEGDLYVVIGRLVKSIPYVMGNFLLLPMLLNGGDSQKQAYQLIDSCEAPALRHSVFRNWISEKNSHNFTEADFDLLKRFLKTPVRDADSVRAISLLFSQISGMYSTNMNFAKFVLLFIKSHHNLIDEDAKKHLSTTISLNKTSFAKVLEKELAKIK